MNSADFHYIFHSNQVTLYFKDSEREIGCHKFSWTDCWRVRFFMHWPGFCNDEGAFHQLVSGLPTGRVVWSPWYLDGLWRDRAMMGESINTATRTVDIPLTVCITLFLHLSWLSLAFFPLPHLTLFLSYFAASISFVSLLLSSSVSFFSPIVPLHWPRL